MNIFLQTPSTISEHTLLTLKDTIRKLLCSSKGVLAWKQHHLLLYYLVFQTIHIPHVFLPSNISATPLPCTPWIETSILYSSHHTLLLHYVLLHNNPSQSLVAQLGHSYLGSLTWWLKLETSSSFYSHISGQVD